jgi:hypothetical protein
VGLLNYLIKNSQKLLNENGLFVTNISSLCKPITDETVRESQVKSVDIDRMTVPLKVYNVLNNRQWMDYLVKNKGLKEDYHDGYKFWQEIVITTIRP